jgi:hypothetical protein
MFAKTKVSQSMIDAVNKVIGEEPTEQKEQVLNEAGAPIKEPTPTGMRVYGSSYGNSAKAKQDQTKSSVDTLKGPKDKEMKEAAKPDFLDMDKDGNKKESMKKAIADKSVKEDLKGDQHKIDANKNKKIDAHDFAILRGKKKIQESDMFFAKRLLDIYEGKGPGSLETFTDNNMGEMSDQQMAKREKIVKSMKKGMAGFKDRYGDKWKNVMYATATKQAMKEDSSDEWDGEFLEEATPAKNQDVADKAYLKHKPGTVKGTMTQIGRFLRGKPEIKEDVVDESVQTQPSKSADKITTDTLAGRMVDGKLNSFKNYKTDLTTSGEQSIPKENDIGDDTQVKNKRTTNPGPVDVKLDDKLSGPTPYTYFAKEKNIKTEEVESQNEATIAGLSGWQKIKNTDKQGNVKDKSGAVHTPMSRAKDLARQSLKKLKSETMMGKISN